MNRQRRADGEVHGKWADHSSTLSFMVCHFETEIKATCKLYKTSQRELKTTENTKHSHYMQKRFVSLQKKKGKNIDDDAAKCRQLIIFCITAKRPFAAAIVVAIYLRPGTFPISAIDRWCCTATLLCAVLCVVLNEDSCSDDTPALIKIRLHECFVYKMCLLCVLMQTLEMVCANEYHRLPVLRCVLPVLYSDCTLFIPTRALTI